VREIDVAVVIVTFKSAALAVDALRSLELERSNPGLRIRAIVIDNASGDLPTIAAAVEANRWSSWVSLIDAPRNGGFAYGNNLGIEHAYRTGRPAYIYLLNPDAQVRRGAIDSLVRFLEGRPEAGIAGSSFENLDGSEWPISFRYPGLLSELDGGVQLGALSRLLQGRVVARIMPQNAPQPVDWICGASMLIRPEVFTTIGGLDEHYFLYFEETDFCHRAKQAGFSTWYVPESRVMHIAGQSTQVTDASIGPRRLPAYWFESRRRYFAVTYGSGRAMAIDLVSIAAHILGHVKSVVLRRSHQAAPHFIRDLVRHSALWPGNRHFPPAHCEAVKLAVTQRPINAPQTPRTASAVP
jgi:N-acetylglucosaminyl-diphospho-decaprenol L-rhamnosyltransferase